MHILETDRLIIREYNKNDTLKLHAIFSDEKTMAFWPQPFTREQTEAWINRSMESTEKLSFGRWAVVLKENGELIGDCGIMLIEIDGNQEFDLGYIFHHEYWKRGYALEAARECMKYGIDTIKIKRLCANMAYNHTSSIRVAERLGMTKEREFYNKRNRDILTYLYVKGS